MLTYNYRQNCIEYETDDGTVIARVWPVYRGDRFQRYTVISEVPIGFSDIPARTIKGAEFIAQAIAAEHEHRQTIATTPAMEAS